MLQICFVTEQAVVLIFRPLFSCLHRSLIGSWCQFVTIFTMTYFSTFNFRYVKSSISVICRSFSCGQDLQLVLQLWSFKLAILFLPNTRTYANHINYSSYLAVLFVKQAYFVLFKTFSPSVDFLYTHIFGQFPSIYLSKNLFIPQVGMLKLTKKIIWIWKAFLRSRFFEAKYKA